MNREEVLAQLRDSIIITDWFSHTMPDKVSDIKPGSREHNQISIWKKLALAPRIVGTMLCLLM